MRSDWIMILCVVMFALFGSGMPGDGRWEVSAREEGGDRAEAARGWAELRTWCVDNQLDMEARMCTFRALQLAPDDSDIASELGRDQREMGEDSAANTRLIRGLGRVVERGIFDSEKETEGGSPAVALRCLLRNRDLEAGYWKLVEQLQERWDELPKKVRRVLVEELAENPAEEAGDILYRIVEQQEEELVITTDANSESEGDVWSESLRSVVARENGKGYELLEAAIPLLDLDQLTVVFEELIQASPPLPMEYYRAVARIIGRPVEQRRRSPEAYYRDALNGDLQREAVSESGEETNVGLHTGFDIPEDPWFHDMKMRLKCIGLFSKAPNEYVKKILDGSAGGLLEKQFPGPVLARVVADQLSDLDIVDYAESRYERDISEGDRQQAVIAVTSEGGATAERWLADTLLRKNGEETTTDSRGKGADKWDAGGDDRTADRAEGWNKWNTPRETLRYLARGLGYHGRRGKLRQAVNYKSTGGRLVCVYPLERRLAALMVWPGFRTINILSHGFAVSPNLYPG